MTMFSKLLKKTPLAQLVHLASRGVLRSSPNADVHQVQGFPLITLKILSQRLNMMTLVDGYSNSFSKILDSFTPRCS